MSIESVMPWNHLILCCPLLLPPSIFPSIRVFSNESALHIRWLKYWSFSFSINSSSEYSQLISFRIDWFWTVVLEKTLESWLDFKEIRPINPKGNQSWIFIERIDAEAEAPILWPPDAKSQLYGKDSDAGKDWGQEEKGATEDEMAGWHHQLSGHEFEQTPGDGEGQEGLECYSPQGHKQSDMT